MDYSKVGKLCSEIVKLAASKGYGSAKLMVKEWGDTDIDLQLLCFKERIHCVRHIISNEDCVYEINDIDDVRKDMIYELKLNIRYDRLNGTYIEDYDSIVDRVRMLVESGDPTYSTLQKLYVNHEILKLHLEKEDIQRAVTIKNYLIRLIDRDIACLNEDPNKITDGEEKLPSAKEEESTEDKYEGFINLFEEFFSNAPELARPKFKSFSARKPKNLKAKSNFDCCE